MAVNKVVVDPITLQDVSISWHAISGDETLQKLATELERAKQ